VLMKGVAADLGFDGCGFGRRDGRCRRQEAPFRLLSKLRVLGDLIIGLTLISTARTRFPAEPPGTIRRFSIILTLGRSPISLINPPAFFLSPARDTSA
jgi:hypothetical protein